LIKKEVQDKLGSVNMTTETLNYSQVLRAIGQLLEGLNIESFVLRAEKNDFVVRERYPRHDRKLRVRQDLRSVWDVIRAQDRRFEDTFESSGVLMFRVTQEAVSLLELVGQKRRQSPGRTPDTGAPSQILRAIGGFVSHQGGRLVEVSKNGKDVYFDFEMPSGELVTERFTVSSLYDYWVQMYADRRKLKGS
jgi:hypothetical protein